jgi:CelD/BcsL family acetyltransferase involved in cellulose biosynthesis
MAGSWDDFWHGRRTKFRKELERTERVAEREGIPVRVELATDAEGIERLVPDVSAVFDAAGRSQIRMAMLSGIYRPFTLEVFHDAAELQRLGLFVLYLGDSPVATQFTLRAKTIMGGGGLRFDPAFGRFSPGQLLFRHVLEWAFSSGCDEFDFGPRDAPYKREWSTGAYDTVDITAFSSESIHAMHRAKAAVDAARRRRRDARRSLELTKQQASTTRS